MKGYVLAAVALLALAPVQGSANILLLVAGGGGGAGSGARWRRRGHDIRR